MEWIVAGENEYEQYNEFVAYVRLDIFDFLWTKYL